MTMPDVSVPAGLIDQLVGAHAIAEAHHDLCSPHSDRDGRGFFHPGDPFGRVLAWLWTSGRKPSAAMYVASYLGEMRNHNPYSPEPGQRLTWTRLRSTIPLAIPDTVLDGRALEEMLAYLDENLPGYYGDSLNEE